MQSTLNGRLKIAFVCYMLCVLLAVTFSIIYLFRSEFMPYHAAAVEQNWHDVDPAFQILTLSLMKASGGGWLGVSIAVCILLFGPFRQGQRWTYWAIPLISLPPMLTALYVTVIVALKTPGSPPWPLLSAGLLILLAGFVLSMTAKQEAFSVEADKAFDKI